MKLLSRLLAALFCCIGYLCSAQKTAIFRNKEYKVYPYRMSLDVNSNYDSDMNSYAAMDRVIPPYPHALPDGDYIVYYNAVPTDSIKKIPPTCAALCKFSNNLLSGHTRFYDYRRQYPGGESLLISDGDYWNGEKTGTWSSMEYSDYGIEISREQCNYKNDVKDGSYLWVEVHGKYNTGNYVNGRKSGTWKANQKVYHFENGKRDGEQIDTLVHLIEKSVYAEAKIVERRFYLLLSGELEYKIDKILITTDFSSAANEFFPDMLLNPVLEWNGERVMSYDLHIYNNNIEQNSFTINDEQDYLHGYKKIIHYKGDDGSIKTLEQESRIESVKGYSEKAWTHKTLINGKLIAEQTFGLGFRDKEELREFRDLELGKKLCGEFENSVLPPKNVRRFKGNWDPYKGVTRYVHFSLKHYQYLYGFLPAIFTKDSVFLDDTSEFAGLRTKVLCTETEVFTYVETRARNTKEYLPLNAVLIKKEGKLNSIDLQVSRLKLDGNLFEVRRHISGFKRLYPADVILNVDGLYLGKVHFSLFRQVYLSQFTQDNSSFFDNGILSGDALFYVNGKPFGGTLLVRDTVYKDTAILEPRMSLKQMSEEKIEITQNNWWQSISKLFAVTDLSPYEESFGQNEIPYTDPNQGITSYQFAQGQFNGVSVFTRVNKMGNLQLQSAKTYRNGKLHGSYFDFQDNYDTVYREFIKWNYVNDEPEGMQISGRLLRSDPYFHRSLASVLNASGGDWLRMNAKMELPGNFDTITAFNKVGGEVFGEFRIVHYNTQLQSTADGDWLADSLLVTDMHGHPVSKYICNEAGNGSVTEYHPFLEGDKGPLIKTTCEFRAFQIVAPLNDFYRNGQLAKTRSWALNSSRSTLERMHTSKGYALRFQEYPGATHTLLDITFNQDPYQGAIGAMSDRAGNWFLYGIDESGPVTMYYPTGVLAHEGELGKGNRIGLWKFYNEKGIKYMEVDFNDGYEKYQEKNAWTYTLFNENGSVLLKGMTSALDFDSDCETLESMPNVLPSSVTELQPDHAYKRINDKNCQLVLMQRYNSNKYAEGYYCIETQSKEGVWKFYKKNGILGEIGQYKNDLKQGRWIAGDLDGVNYLEDVCFDPGDSLAIKKRLLNISFSQSIWDAGEESRSNNSFVKLDNMEGDASDWNGTRLQRYFFEKPVGIDLTKPDSEEWHQYFRNTGVRKYGHGMEMMYR